MLRSELAQRLNDKFPELTLTDVETSVRVILDEISNSLAVGDRVEIRGFGSFKSVYRPPRNSRNPKTGASVKVPERHQPHFKAGCVLSDIVNKICR